MVRRAAFVLFLLVLFAGARPSARASAQVTPADSAEVLLDAASRFAAEGRPDVAEALYRSILERFPSTPAAEVARARLGESWAAGTAGSGRVELQVWTTLYGLWLGVAVPGALGAEQSEPYGFGLLLGGPAGFVAGKKIAGSRALTEGQARAITLGGTWGSWQGLGWAEVLDLGRDRVCYPDGSGGEYCSDEGDPSEETFAAMILGGAAGIATGAMLSNHAISPGVATAVNFGALWGTWLGFGFGDLVDLEDDALLTATLMGGNAGLLAMALKAPGWNPTRSRARIVSIYGVIGTVSALGVDLLLRPDDDKVALGIALAGSVVGLALGAGAARDHGSPGDEPRPGAMGAPAGGTPPAGALLNLSGGRWSVGTPLPTPRLLELDGPRGLIRKPALGVTLLSARFF